LRFSCPIVLTFNQIVTQDSATLNPKYLAIKIMNADHRSICKFDSDISGFLKVVSEMNMVFAAVKEPNAERSMLFKEVSGYPRFIAHAYPPDQQYWWEGNQMTVLNDRASSRAHCVGRSQEIHLLETFVQGETQQKLVAVKGIGGIG
jgi:hypothetical protein